MIEKAVQIFIFLSRKILINWGWLTNILIKNSIYQLLIPNAHKYVTIKVTS